jgi:DNA-binding response OmpR family regulator
MALPAGEMHLSSSRQAGRRSIAAARPIRTVRGAGYSFDERFGRTA